MHATSLSRRIRMMAACLLLSAFLWPSASMAQHRFRSFDMGPVVGVLVPEADTGMRTGFWYGGQVTHHFDPFTADNPWGNLAFRALWEGTVTNFDTEARERVDLIVLSAAVLWEFAPDPYVHPYVSLGTGMVLADGTPSGLPLIPRTIFMVGGGVQFAPAKHFFADLQARAMLHENIPFGVIGVPTGPVGHLLITLSFGGKA